MRRDADPGTAHAWREGIETLIQSRTMSGRKSDRRPVEVANPRPGTPCRISRGRALEHCAAGIAYWLRDGRLRFRGLDSSERRRSDVYVDRRADEEGAIWWNGSDTRRTAMHKPGENVQFASPYVAAMKAGC